MATGTELMMQCAPTIGDVALRLAQELAHIAVARATQTRDWTEHPMFGIAVDTDQLALAYQAKLDELREVLALTPEKPLYGHKTGAKARTHWVAFVKTPNAEITGSALLRSPG